MGNCLYEMNVGSVAERVKAPFLRRPCDHVGMIYVQLLYPHRTRCCVLG